VYLRCSRHRGLRVNPNPNISISIYIHISLYLSINLYIYTSIYLSIHIDRQIDISGLTDAAQATLGFSGPQSVAGDHLPRDIGDCPPALGIQSVVWVVNLGSPEVDCPRETPTTLLPSSSCSPTRYYSAGSPLSIAAALSLTFSFPHTVLLRRVSPRYRRRSFAHILVHIVPVHIHIMSCAVCTSAQCVLGMLCTIIAHSRMSRVPHLLQAPRSPPARTTAPRINPPPPPSETSGNTPPSVFSPLCGL